MKNERLRNVLVFYTVIAQPFILHYSFFHFQTLLQEFELIPFFLQKLYRPWQRILQISVLPGLQ